MNRDEIIRIACEAGLCDDDGYSYSGNMPDIERFANLVAAAEREAIEQRIHKLDITLHTRLYVINHAIRARGLQDMNKQAEQNGEEL
jgi:hypothetical protein